MINYDELAKQHGANIDYDALASKSGGSIFDSVEQSRQSIFGEIAPLAGGSNFNRLGLSGIPNPADQSDNIVRRFVRGLVSPVVQTFARPVQAIQSLVTGRTPEYNIPSAVGYINVPNPSNEQNPIRKAIGRGAQTVAFGAGPALGGGLFAGGSSLEEGDRPLVVALKTLGGVVAGKLTDLAVNKAGDYLLKKAQTMYQSALKPSLSKGNVGKVPDIVNTGLNTGIVLSESGVQKTSNLIDDLENQLGEAIDKSAGITRDVTGKVVSRTGKPALVPTAPLKDFVNEAKNVLGQTTDVTRSKEAIKEIDTIYDNFAKEYGDYVPVDVAQELKTNTYIWLRKEYGKLSSPVIEANKQLVRGLKEGIVDVAPIVGNINPQLKSLYQFDEALQRAKGRIGNLNLLGLGTKILLTPSHKINVILGAVDAIFGPTGKTFTAIQLNKLSKLASKLTPAEKQFISTAVKGILKSGPNSLIGQ